MMTIRSYRLLILAVMLFGLLLIGCTPSEDANTHDDSVEPATPGATAVGLPNPASVHCTEQGGVLEMRADASGGQVGVCLFADGSECEEWAFLRGECAPENTQLFETLWALQSYNGQPPLPGTMPTLKISSDWQLGGNTGCNSFFGSVTRDGDAWQMGEMGSTLMACLEGMEQETAVLTLLQAVTHHTLAAGRLTLHTPTGDLVFTPAQNATLENSLWTLNGIATDESVVSTWIDSEINIQFTEGKVMGYTGCNDFFGSYQLDGATLTLSELGQTKRACDEERGQRELAWVLALADVAAYRIEMSSLTLLDADGRILLLLTTDSLKSGF